jgi:hypothetical protein
VLLLDPPVLGPGGGIHHRAHGLDEGRRLQGQGRHGQAVAGDGLSQQQHPGLVSLRVLGQLLQHQLSPAALHSGRQDDEGGLVMAKGNEGIRHGRGEDDLVPLAREQPFDGGDGGDVVVDEEDRGGHGSRPSLQHGAGIHVDRDLHP